MVLLWILQCVFRQGLRVVLHRLNASVRLLFGKRCVVPEDSIERGTETRFNSMSECAAAWDYHRGSHSNTGFPYTWIGAEKYWATLPRHGLGSTLSKHVLSVLDLRLIASNDVNCADSVSMALLQVRNYQ